MGKGSLWSIVLVALPGLVHASPQLRPNSERPPERNPSASTGRAGNASMTARALVSKTGSTELEVTTGALDTAGPPGSITKLQLTGFDADGNTAWTKNYTGLSGAGSVRYTYDAFVRGMPLQVQANISGIDGHRTNVISLPVTVKARPDLVVARIEHPPEAPAATPIVIDAVVREIVGDTRAVANCYLEVDGLRVDEIRGLFVDGGQAATCSFTHIFESAGSHDVRVTLGDIVPGDDDLTNNAGTSQIVIRNRDSAAPVDYFLEAYDFVEESDYHSYGWFDQTDYDGTSGDFSSRSGNLFLDESSFVYASSSVAARWPLAVSYRGIADGAAIMQFSSDQLEPTVSWSDGGSHWSQWFQLVENNEYVLISSGAFNGIENTNIQIQRWAGQYRFYSYQYERTFNAYTGETYFYSFVSECCPETWEYAGMHWPMTSSFAAELSITDSAGREFSVQDSTPLSVLENHHEPWTESCHTQEWDGGVASFCTGSLFRRSHTAGFIVGHSGP